MINIDLVIAETKIVTLAPLNIPPLLIVSWRSFPRAGAATTGARDYTVPLSRHGKLVRETNTLGPIPELRREQWAPGDQTTWPMSDQFRTVCTLNLRLESIANVL